MAETLLRPDTNLPAGGVSAAIPDVTEPWRDSAAKPFIEIRGVSKQFGTFVALQDVSLKIYKGELFSLLGGSGCGKTTLLRMIAGFETPSSGSIIIDGQDMTGVPPYERPVNMMFQSYALFPHMSVFNNVAYGLKKDGVARAEIAKRVDEALALVQLRPYAERKPHQLSGGQRQRVALARSLVKRPKALLLDEPLGALDKKLREATQYELMNIQDKVGITFIVVTHDQEEAMTLSTRIAVMDRGQVYQVGRPIEIYEYPNCRFTAGFIGTMNMFEGVVLGLEDRLLRVKGKEGGDFLLAHPGAPVPDGTPVWVAVRPEKIRLSLTPVAATQNMVAGKVKDLGYFGGTTSYRIDVGDGRLVSVNVTNADRALALRADWDERVFLTWDPASAVLLTE
ncbi:MULTISPECIES: ABC transporter ATP-binding protein [unclassified Acidisoma]|jgi:putrescine transport system ATP-binding protein|uniref:ABC transporter ATP-binding protein n=1 Tax=unclassified Acidisoma TaxID=2634065 RepID=UPI00131C11AC|nr:MULTISPECIES: ABC transporter ATP-binding protein [unclassified Acidisoma]